MTTSRRDTNNDNKLTWSEYIAAYEKKIGTATISSGTLNYLSGEFRLLDTNHDNAISRKEIHNRFGAVTALAHIDELQYETDLEESAAVAGTQLLWL